MNQIPIDNLLSNLCRRIPVPDDISEQLELASWRKIINQRFSSLFKRPQPILSHTRPCFGFFHPLLTLLLFRFLFWRRQNTKTSLGHLLVVINFPGLQSDVLRTNTYSCGLRPGLNHLDVYREPDRIAASRQCLNLY